MLKKRLIAAIVVKDGIAVQSIGFRKFLPVGRPEIAAELLNRWGIDEILLQDISPCRNGGKPDLKLLAAVAAKCFVPLTVAGGIRSLDDARAIIQNGGDKLAINSAAIEKPSIVRSISDHFGRQCVVASIDAVRTEDGRYQATTDGGSKPTGRPPADVAKLLEDHGAGEILITAVDRDGTKQGYDVALIESVAGAVNIPVIANAGVGHPQHFLDAFQIPGVSAAAAANYFHFTEHSVLTTKAYLAAKGADLRCDTAASYDGHSFHAEGRVAKLPDRALEELFFEYFPEEVI